MTQLLFDDSRTSLDAVRFVVVDIETTGASPNSCEITELAAVVVKGGVIADTYESLVSIDSEISSQISQLTGIHQQMLIGAPKIDKVLSRFLELAEGSVIVGHNVQFDLSFIRTSLQRLAKSAFLDFETVDTLALSRKLLSGEVSNFRLGTLANQLRLDHLPTHRAMNDVMATVDLLHLLIDRASRFGVLTLDELMQLPSKLHTKYKAKMKLSNYIPRAQGVYWMSDHLGTVIYVGKAVDLNARYRSYFTSDSRRKVLPMLESLHGYSFVVCKSELESLIVESRMIQQLRPRFNHQGKISPLDYCYIRTEISKTNGSLKVTRVRMKSEFNHLSPDIIGPFRSMKNARLAEAALRKALNLGVNPCEGSSSKPRLIDHESILKFDTKNHNDGELLTPRWLSKQLNAILTILSQAQEFESAEKLRLGSHFLMLGFVRQYVVQTLNNHNRLEITSVLTSRSLEVHNGRVQLDLPNCKTLTLSHLGTVSRRDLQTNDILVNNIASAAIEELSTIPNNQTQALTFEETWIIWAALTKGDEWFISSPDTQLSMPLDLAHSSFLPKPPLLKTRSKLSGEPIA